MRAISVVAFAGLIVLAACGNVPPATSPTTPPVASPASTSMLPSTDPTPSADAASPSIEELHLLGNARLDLRGTCRPLRTDLPAKAVAGVECHPDSAIADRAAVFLFDTQVDVMATYLALVDANGIVPRTNGGRCLVGAASEGAYTPGDSGPDLLPVRQACFVDAAGVAHWIAIQPPFVLMTVDGPVGVVNGMPGVEQFGWLGNQDAPGAPTIWRGDGPASPEK